MNFAIMSLCNLFMFVLPNFIGFKMIHIKLLSTKRHYLRSSKTCFLTIVKRQECHKDVVGTSNVCNLPQNKNNSTNMANKILKCLIITKNFQKKDLTVIKHDVE